MGGSKAAPPNGGAATFIHIRVRGGAASRCKRASPWRFGLSPIRERYAIPVLIAEITRSANRSTSSIVV
jgi:hypothetical protein